MSFDEEHLNGHEECNFEIRRLQARVKELETEQNDLARALFKIRSLTMSCYGDEARLGEAWRGKLIAKIADDAVFGIDETLLFEVKAAEAAKGAIMPCSPNETIAARPDSLTEKRAWSYLPTYDIDPEWQKRHDAKKRRAEPGTAAALLDFCGMLQVTWPAAQPTKEEARWILDLYEVCSMRQVASVVLHSDGNQIHGSDLIESARKTLEATE